jgi:NADH-quinone oxidoreductase subunit J
MNITAHQLLFYVFSTLAIASGIWVILSKNPVRAVLSLVFTFINMAAIWLLLEAEFLAIVLVLVYVGAVMVLFLFVVMMIDMETPELTVSKFVKYWPLGALAGAVFLAIIVLILDQHYALNIVFNPEPLPADYSHVKVLGHLLYTDFLLPFEMAGVILLVAMVAAIALTFRGKRNQKSQIPADQIRVTKQERLTVLKMTSIKGENP